MDWFNGQYSWDRIGIQRDPDQDEALSPEEVMNKWYNADAFTYKALI